MKQVIQINGFAQYFDGEFTCVWTNSGDVWYGDSYGSEIPADRLALDLHRLRREGRVSVYRLTDMSVVAIVEYRRGEYYVKSPEYYGPYETLYLEADMLAHIANLY